MPRVLLIFFVIAVAFWVVSIVDCAVQPADRHRGVNKAAWLAIVIVIPVLGGLLWFAIGRTRRHKAGVGRRAPDDDPDFLSGLGAGGYGSTADQDERIRQLEEELARLDVESDDPRTEQGSTETDDSDGEDPRDPRHGSIS